MNITYTQNGDYLIPNIVIRKTCLLYTSRKPRANVARGLPLGIPAGRSLLFRLRLDFFALFPHGLQDRGLLLKLGGLFAGQRLDTFQSVSRPDGVVRELPLPCAYPPYAG